MISADRDTVVITNVVIDEELLDVAHHLHRKLGRENAGILRLILFQDVGLNRSAHQRQGFLPDARIRLGVNNQLTGHTQQPEPKPVVALGQISFVGWTVFAFEVRIDFL